MKKIWILNHYATNTFESKGGRHFWFAKELKKQGYEPIIICSSFIHKGSVNYTEPNKEFIVKNNGDIQYVFIANKKYKGNGFARIKNMVEYFWRLQKNYKKIERLVGKPDVIIGSSVHPLACLAAINIGKKYNIKKIIEIRDLWPETLVEMGILKRNSILTKLLYQGEKWLYKNADDVIFTMEGGHQYIKDRKWDNDINLEHIHYINNGVDLEKFKEQEKKDFIDDDLESKSLKIIYTGTIAKVNNLKRIIEVASKLKNETEIKFLIYGDGDEKEELKNYCSMNEINNVIFKGHVNKEKIPFILSKGDILLINCSPETEQLVLNYGVSYNKLFEYLAAEKIILQTLNCGYNILEKENCGFSISADSEIDEIVECIRKIEKMNEKEKSVYKENCRKIIKNYDFKKLTKNLINIIEKER